MKLRFWGDNLRSRKEVKTLSVQSYRTNPLCDSVIFMIFPQDAYASAHLQSKINISPSFHLVTCFNIIWIELLCSFPSPWIEGSISNYNHTSHPELLSLNNTNNSNRTFLELRWGEVILSGWLFEDVGIIQLGDVVLTQPLTANHCPLAWPDFRRLSCQRNLIANIKDNWAGD